MPTSIPVKKTISAVSVLLFALLFMTWSIFEFGDSRSEYANSNGNDADGVPHESVIYGNVTIENSAMVSRGTVIATTRKSARPVGFGHVSNGKYLIAGLPEGPVELSFTPQVKTYSSEGVESPPESASLIQHVQKPANVTKQWHDRLGLTPSTLADGGKKRSSGSLPSRLSRFWSA